MVFFLQYLAVLPFLGLAKIVSRRLFLGIGGGLGLAAFMVLAGRRKRAIRNVAGALKCGEDAARRIARASFVHFGNVAFEVLRLIAGGANAREIEALFDDADEPFGRMVQIGEAAGGKVIYITAHLGNWEYFGSYMGIRNRPFTVIGRAINNPYIDRLVTQSREAFGGTLVDKEGAMMSLARELKAGHPVGLLPDQKSNDRHSVKLDFLGQPAGTTLGVAKLAKRFGAVILPVAVVMTPEKRYRLIVQEPIPYTPQDADDRIMQRVNDVLGDMIRAYPEQWFWMHNRWKQ